MQIFGEILEVSVLPVTWEHESNITMNPNLLGRPCFMAKGSDGKWIDWIHSANRKYFCPDGEFVPRLLLIRALIPHRGERLFASPWPSDREKLTPGTSMLFQYAWEQQFKEAA